MKCALKFSLFSIIQSSHTKLVESTYILSSLWSSVWWSHLLFFVVRFLYDQSAILYPFSDPDFSSWISRANLWTWSLRHHLFWVCLSPYFTWFSIGRLSFILYKKFIPTGEGHGQGILLKLWKNTSATLFLLCK